MLHALAAAASGRDVWWLHGARNRAQEPFAAESRSLLAGLARGHRHVCYSRRAPGTSRDATIRRAGRLSTSVLAGLGLPRDADAYICGPAAFMAEMSAALGPGHRGAAACAPRSSAPRPRRRQASRPRPPGRRTRPRVSRRRPGVAFARSGLTVRWAPRYGSLLELAEACDVPVRWSCRTGVCHTCETGLMSGTVSYSPDPVDSPPMAAR